ncbi:circularly permuted type 2 ATP-grasp protein [Dankookia sp. P2]|uniref:circularly permuted type 2 ATP-grasp protein n=1 Tax=Dankookia sp. P2 TaxID=3423955 RepID=UPI003D66C580
MDVLLRRGRRQADGPAGGRPEPGAHGVAGLLDAVRSGTVRIVNDPGAGFAEAPALAAFLPALAERLLDEELRLAGARTLWLGDPAARALVGADLGRWMVRRAVDGTVRSITAAALPETARAELAQRILAAPEDYAVSERMPASVAPCVRGRRGWSRGQ